MYRLFVAVALPETVLAELKPLCSGLPGAKWADTDVMHITLRFIGEVDGGVAEDIHLALSRIEAPPFVLTLAGVDCFAQAGKVHTLWVGIEKEPLLIHLREKVQGALLRCDVKPEPRRFRPHVTLARFRNGTHDDRFGAYLQRNNQFRSSPFSVASFTLFRSHLGAGGPYHEQLAEYALQTGRRSPHQLCGGAPASAQGS